jgi:hypothetical protein
MSLTTLGLKASQLSLHNLSCISLFFHPAFGIQSSQMRDIQVSSLKAV